MSKCPECGCCREGGICSNCQEELYILTYQYDYVESISDDFAEKAEEQKAFLKKEN